MMARAAAQCFGPLGDGTHDLDWYDARIIQVEASLAKLNSLLKILQAVATNLKKNQRNDSEVIPLVNYMIALAQGPLFNVHPIIRKRYSLLYQFKPCKLTDVEIAPNSIQYSLVVDFPAVPEDMSVFAKNIYQSNLQWKLLEALQTIAKNSVRLFERASRQLQLERRSHRATDGFGRLMIFDRAAIQDLLNAPEAEVCLDLAVLITDVSKDTSPSSFQKLQLQVLNKLTESIKDKMFPALRMYYFQLHRYSKSNSTFEEAVKQLPYWQSSLHRVYAFLLRCLSVTDVIISVLRQIYFPMKRYFSNIKTKLLSENVLDFLAALDKIDRICMNPDDGLRADLLVSLNHYSQKGRLFHVDHNNLLDGYNNCISKVVPKLRDLMGNVEQFLHVWRFIQANKDVSEKLQTMDEHQLESMLRERLEVDKLASVERLHAAGQRGDSGVRNLNRTVTGNAESYTSKPQVTVKRSGSTSRQSSSSPSPGLLTPSRMSKTNSRSSSNLHSPSTISRKGSIMESRYLQPGASSRVQRVSNGRVSGGRPRSSSLQSSFVGIGKDIKTSPLPSRSNSMQTGAAFNQKMLQETAKHIVKTQNSISTNTSKKLARKAPVELASNTTNEGTLGSNTRGNRSRSNSTTLPSLQNLSISGSGETTDTRKTNDSGVGKIETAAEEGRVIIKHVRFTGVPPMTDKEDPKPTRQGWYKKPDVLHYPPPPTQRTSYYDRRRQEGIAFRTSLRDERTKNDVDGVKESSRLKLASKLFDKLR